MLTGVHHGSLKLGGALAQFVNHQRQLDGFRARAQDRDNATLHEDCPLSKRSGTLKDLNVLLES